MRGHQLHRIPGEAGPDADNEQAANIDLQKFCRKDPRAAEKFTNDTRDLAALCAISLTIELEKR